MIRLEGYCQEFPNAKMRLINVEPKSINGNIIFDHSLVVTSTVTNFTKLIMTVDKKCKKSDSRDCGSCMNFTLRNIGHVIEDRQSPLSKAIRYEPPLTLPLKPVSKNDRCCVQVGDKRHLLVVCQN
ncbi:unnamed protein product [Acanthoscelides obtectus]|uniref:Uncharacterized protein n=1 Tax=Acanthoscelides obtectus TaxID=200917 RepID=A0A9P0MHK0_ACAOB|nr:unnamed protein product [Acanthoscelides obtectus]CAH2014270.1 unnamed protein product [Acanthoscelides obtectus]CAK1631362.1 hypothetical protein AOBTE_LOCUS6907 [Acanthoscelides obtectus]CAK1631395.1 hypothetical protein AOBTE_LOCUS6928 [Acanthoscelides obtectus]